MKRNLLLASILLAAVSAWAQTDPVVMSVNGIDVHRSEFEYSYNKNNGETAVDKKSVDEYVELFVNYKLKVAAALDAKLDTLTSFRQEYAMYRDQQVRPTIVTDVEIEAEARRMYDRTKEALGARGLIHPAHILLELSTQATLQEQERIKARIDSVYRALQNGADFSALAQNVSQDPGSASRGGLLPWIGQGQTFKEFEDVAFSLQAGQMSTPFLTPVGYHIVMMKERKQLEPYDSLKTELLQALERRGIREEIVDAKLKNMIDASQGALSRDEILTRRSDSLATVDPEMKYLFQEYHDGLLLFEISSREVWDKAASDEVALRAWFETHRKNYTWDSPRYKGIAYHVKDKKDVKAVRNCVKNLPFDEWTEALRSTFNSDSVIRIRVEKGLFRPGDNATVDKLVFKTSSEVVSLKDYPIDAVYGKKLKKPADYSDVRTQVVEDYQGYLERQWVEALRKRYPVSINQEVLKTVNKHQ
jgi:peptidyl-prolyl cis-trans isomerase SurA